MKQDALQGAEKYTKAHQRKKRWYIVMTGLACVVVFCTVYALILPAVTMESEVLTDDSAYVDSIAISQYDTGTAPFDGDDNAGNDSSSTNNVVRTFDTVTYNINVKYEAYENGKYFAEARVKLELVLPVNSRQAEFDLAAMGWLDQTAGYAPNVETKTINGVECQVLTGYKHLLPSADNSYVVPGEFGENVTVNIKMMNNKDTIAPIFSAAMEHNTWDGECTKHNNIEEKKTVTAEIITISAAPKYNVQIKKAFATELSQTYDFSSGTSDVINPDKALNLDAGKRPGRIYTMGVTLQLYNDNASKGMRGIELPKGNITFDIKLSSKFQPVYSTEDNTTVNGDVRDVTADYTPLVWSYGPQSDGNNPDRITWFTTYNYAFGHAAPWNKNDDRDSGCYNGGTWTAKQNGNTVSFTVKDYEFDGVFPCTDAGDSWTTPTYYNKPTGIHNIGCFSAAELYIVQPYTTKSGIDVREDFSTGENSQSVGTGTCIDGSFIMTVEDVNLNATSVSDQQLASASDSNANQSAKSDDKLEFTVNLKNQGSYEQRLVYSHKDSEGIFDIFGPGSNQPNCAQNGNDWAVIGTEFRLNFGGYAQTNGDAANKMCAAKWLLKFDPEAIELKPTTDSNWSKAYYQYQARYAVKPDGTRWRDDKELKETSMFQLCYYSSIAEANSHGEIVGILVEAAPWSNIEIGWIPVGIVETYFFQTAKVKEDHSLANRRFIITEESMIWTVDDFTVAGQMIPSLLGNNPSSPTTLPKYTFYINSPSVYLNGDGVYDQHGGGSTQGDTLLVLSYQASILKKVEQKLPDGTAKYNYNLDADQRVIDFVLDPSVDYGGLKPEQKQTTTVTIVDKLPQYLYYRSGSSYFGGTYKQTSANGGTQGTVTGGELKEPSVVTNADGTQTLTWTIPDVVVGEKMPLIHYSVNVGTKGDETKDVPLSTTNLTNTVEISATGDDRIHSISCGNVAEVGVVLTRGTASSYGKYSKNTVVEPDGEINYVIFYDNNSAAPISDIVLLDTMPRDKYLDNAFTGSYTVTSWKLNVSKCEPSGFKLYYTMKEEYAGKTINEIPVSDITNSEKWTPVSINEDGSVTDMNGKMPVAWALIGTLNANKGVYVDLTIKLEPGATYGTNNVYHNTFSHGNIVTTTEEYSVIRTLEGLTWMDDNADGVQDEDADRRISGVNVSLWKLKNNGDPANKNDYEPYCYPGTSTNIVIQTGKQISVRASNAEAAETYEQGRYKFTDLPAGTFAVKFEDGTTQTISNYIASPANRDGSNDALDSDGIATYSNDKSRLQETVILGIEMPKAEEMKVVLYESKCHDSGFYERGYELPKSGGVGVEIYTAGGFLMFTSAAFVLLNKHSRRRKS